MRIVRFLIVYEKQCIVYCGTTTLQNTFSNIVWISVLFQDDVL